MVLCVRGHARASLQRLRSGLEYVHNRRPMSRVQPPMAIDVVSELRRVVAARRLVRDKRLEAISRRARGTRRTWFSARSAPSALNVVASGSFPPGAPSHALV